MPKKETVTPIRRQYLELKRQYPNAILFFRLGDFYETFDEDAEIVSRELDIVLTSRNVAKGVRVPMAGIPYHAVEGYLAKLIAKGYHVAIAEQIGEPGKGLMRREVVRVVTPGTVVEPNLVPSERNNYLVAVVVEERRAGIAYADITTGEFAATELTGPDLAGTVRAELLRLRPAEILHPEGWTPPPDAPGHPTAWPAWRFEAARCEETLRDHFDVAALDGFGLRGKPLAIGAAGAIIQYLRETQPAALPLLTGLNTYSLHEFMVLDAATRRNLELTETLRDGSVQGSLLGVLDRTVTPMGKRLLRQWVSKPLLDVQRIRRRQEGVAFFFERPLVRAEVRQALRRIGDLERLTNRVASGTAQPRDLVALRETLRHIPPLLQALPQEAQEPLAEVLQSLDPCAEALDLLERAIADDPPATLQNIGVIRPGFSPELDQVVRDSQHARDYIANLEKVERQRTGIKNLKVGYNKVFGYYIEVTKANAHLVPKHYIRKQTLVNAERYITPEMKEYEALVLNAEERIREIEGRLFKGICAELSRWAARLRRTARAIARLDVLAALAEAAVEGDYTRPEVVDEDVLEIRDGRHPVVERTLEGERFVPNDTVFEEGERIRILTGPNMAGKCVTGDTWVFTEQGPRPIADLQPPSAPQGAFAPLGLAVRAPQGMRLATHFYTGGKTPTVRITTRLGFVLEGTPDHKVWVRFPDGTEGWQRLGELAPGDVVALAYGFDLWGQEVALHTPQARALRRGKRYRLPERLTEDLAYLLGLLVGDGTLTYPYAVVFTTGDEYLAQTFKRIVAQTFGYRVGTKANGKDHFVTSKQIRVFLAELGLGYHAAAEKEVPKVILQAPRPMVIAFLQGLFDADGYVSTRYGNVRFSTTSTRLARQVQVLLLNLGILASLHPKPTSRRLSYRLSIDGEQAIRFHQTVGFRLPRKRARAALASTIRRPNVGGIPYLAPLLRRIQQRIVSTPNKTQPLKAAKTINSVFYSYLPRGRNPSYAKLAQLVAYCHENGVDCVEIERLLHQRYFYDTVAQVEPGEAEVFDLSVAQEHAYIANGFVSHNSTYLRQVALIVLMAQMGSFVPARKARIGVVDRIFTRIGAQDEIHAGQSTFMVEMIETANILHHATPRSLLILDEIGRGTSTYDGLAIAWAVVEYIHNHPKLRSKTLFATHYHELTQLADLLPGVRNYNVAVSEAEGKVVFLHKIVPGGADRSYGIHVAQLAGLPKPVIQRANEILRELEATSGRAVRLTPETPRQLALFPETNPLVEELKRLDINNLTPIEALNRLYEWQRRFVARASDEN